MGGSLTGKVAQIFWIRGSHSPEQWLILGRIIQLIDLQWVQHYSQELPNYCYFYIITYFPFSG